MKLKVVSLSDIIESYSEEDVRVLLMTFQTLKITEHHGAADVEHFLHYKALEFEKSSIARTHLVFASINEETFLAGYFALSNKGFSITRENFHGLSRSFQKKLMGFGHKSDKEEFQISGILLGQLGKNYNEAFIPQNNILTGSDLLEIAYQKAISANKIVAVRNFHLECENHPKLISFYEKNGFQALKGQLSENGLVIMVKRIVNIPMSRRLFSLIEDDAEKEKFQ